jgi:hypothetical protein
MLKLWENSGAAGVLDAPPRSSPRAAVGGGHSMADSQSTNSITRVCGKCRREQVLEAFTSDRRKTFGRSHECRACARARHRARAARLYQASAAERARRQKSRTVGTPERQRARQMVQRAVYDGVLIKPHACEGCGSEAVVLHGHHDDYTQPFAVKWLCTACHGQLHRKPLPIVTSEPLPPKAPPTHCKHGHLLSGENIRIRRTAGRVGHRDCLTCERLRDRQRSLRKLLAAVPGTQEPA